MRFISKTWRPPRWLSSNPGESSVTLSHLQSTSVESGHTGSLVCVFLAESGCVQSPAKKQMLVSTEDVGRAMLNAACFPCAGSSLLWTPLWGRCHVAPHSMASAGEGTGLGRPASLPWEAASQWKSFPKKAADVLY